MLDFETQSLFIQEYAEKELELATKAYTIIESEKENHHFNAVLVSAESINDLKSAYPNYFTDIEKFVDRIDAIIEDD